MHSIERMIFLFFLDFLLHHLRCLLFNLGIHLSSFILLASEISPSSSSLELELSFDEIS